MEKTYRILAINPGSTSTKISVFENLQEVYAETLRHSSEELQPFQYVADQFAFRKALIVEALEKAGIDLQIISAVIGRGGLVKPIPSGVYEMNDALKHDLLHSQLGDHASNLGGLLAADIAAMIPGVKAYIADPVVVDEMEDVARLTGHPQIRRVSIFHALNQKAVARAYARTLGKRYEELNLVIAHIGGGFSIGAHRHGRVIDATNAMDGESAFTPERSGALPARQVVDLCFSGKYTHREVRRMISGAGGLVALTGSSHVGELIERGKNGDQKILQIIDAMSYNIGKTVGSMAAVLHGEVDAILITGGVAYNTYVCDYVKEMVKFIAPVVVMAGEDEMRALAENALSVLQGKRQPSVYA